MGGAAHSATLAAPPTVTSSDATEIGPSKAQLNGTVNPNGLDTTWYFEFGKTTAYGTKTPTHGAGSGTDPRAESSLQRGLESGVTYHFRIVAGNSAGSSVSPDRTFVTDAPPAVKTGGAGDVTATTATLTGTINPRGRGSQVWFEYGTTSRYGSRTPVQDAGNGTTDRSVSASIAGLQPARMYHFRIAGRSDAGTVHGGDAHFSTPVTPTVATRPATQIGADRATLNGDVNPQGRNTSWYFEYGPTTSYGSQTSATAMGNGTTTLAVSFEVTGLTSSTTYHYRVVAISPGGTVRGPDASFATLGPPAVQTGVVTRLSTSNAVVAGSVDPRGLAATYWVEYGRTTAYGLRTGSSSLQAGTGVTAVSFPLAGLAPGMRYHYRVVAQSAGGTTVGDDRSFGTSPLPRNPQGRVVRCTIVGTVAPDRLRGTPGPDVICGLGGGDVVFGLGGNDVIYGGPGDDVIDGGAGNDKIYGGLGRDRLAGGFGRDMVDGGRGDDVLLGGPGRDLLMARDAVRDVVNGGPGRDHARIDGRRDRRVSIEQVLR
jgi:Ca2+-binding RTX toxin-like protein